jgi:RNA ligase (TIGR02306 family)
MRKLASIQKISSLEPIPGADTIEKATVLGWQLVVKRGEFKVGDLVVYCEVDSIFPDRPEFKFLETRGMRIKTIKLRGQISQGICFPLSILPLDFPITVDRDCTEVLGIKKYESSLPACLSGVARGKLPSFIPKTDETRVQVLQRVLDKYRGESCYVTEKLDGSSATFYLKDGEFGVCSRNLDLVEDSSNSFWKVARELDIESKLRSLDRNIAIQGELVGPGVQGNKLKLDAHTVMFFNVFDIDRFEYLDFPDFLSTINSLSLPLVPILDVDYKLENDIEAIVRKATIRSQIIKSVWAEGIVIRPHIEKIDLLLSTESFNNGRVSFKAINPEFLLKYGC